MDIRKATLGLLVALTALAIVIIVLLVTPDAEAQYGGRDEGRLGWLRNNDHKEIYRMVVDVENNVVCYSYRYAVGAPKTDSFFACVVLPVEQPCDGS